jgi:hypothetical protein
MKRRIYRTNKSQIMGLLAGPDHIGRRWEMRELVYACTGPVSTAAERLAWQRSIHRICIALQQMGLMTIEKKPMRGSRAYYTYTEKT